MEIHKRIAPNNRFAASRKREMKPKITLLVEDNPDDEYLTVRAFHKANVSSELIVVRDGCEAIEYLFGEGRHADRDSSNQPALILLDLKLPKIDGIEVLRRLRGKARTRFIPVVILTTSREDRDVIAGYHSGANSYIRKPVNFEEFVRAVGEILSYRGSSPRCTSSSISSDFAGAITQIRHRKQA